MGATFDARIAALAARQHGVFTTRQVLELGGTSDHVRTRVRQGRWVALCRGAYAVAGVPIAYRGRLMAATLLSDGGAISDRAGAALHGMAGFVAPPPELTVVGGGGTRNPLAVVHRRQAYRSTRIDGIRVGSSDQIIGDLAGTVSRERLDRLVEEQVIARRLPFGRIEDLALARTAGRARGAADLRAIVEARGASAGVPESMLEVVLRRLLGSLGVPPVIYQMDAPWLVPGAGRVDAAIPEWLLVVEADGRAWHARLGDFGRDQSRSRLALSVGWATVRFGYADLTDAFDVCLAELLAIGAERARLLAGRP